ncbi:DUF3784 domain-containing protein [Anaerococcus vaginalis]|uniref:DUF3784 domain-containing protein n=2 Tax=Anaerococcus vaginalis TaxID=33037 RepID=C7HVP5_9FIRM|nr:hypothetical protein [Anaerococcus vaginalis]EEU12185.1 hypothetical protein HMPREF0078_1481 [Anaerococcus vaginalis ATCC 51170]QQB61816.1 DUF3784 domain-containing protein [Anaerococcus vaginalis]
MKLFKIISLILAIAFVFFGFNIYFKKKYNLINNFEKDYKNGLKDENHAKNVGLIELIIGILFFIIFLKISL